MTGAFDASTLLLPDAIAHHGRWRPAHAALICGDDRRNWAEFDAATNRIANGLLALGLERGARLAVLMDNSLEMVELFFGAGKAGISVVPINLSVTDAAVAGMLADSGATAVAASGQHVARLRSMPPSISACWRARFRLDADLSGAADWIELRSWRDAQSATQPAMRIAADDECNIIYSSGTTSTPKGIVHSHGCRYYWASDCGQALRYHSGAVTVCSIGLYSNIMWVSMLATLLVGGTLVIERGFDAQRLLGTIARHRVTHGAFVPVQLQRLLDTPTGQHDLQSLQAIMCCGSPLPVAVKRAIPAHLRCELIELYGLTEGLVTTLDPEDLPRRLESVGKPIPGQQLKLIGDDGREVRGEGAGEIVGLGRLTMSGYCNRPDATREATWTDEQGRCWLRTGDVGRIDAEGFLFVVDRKKDLILSGGQNIYPADIESVLLEHPAVAEVAVVGVPSDRWGESPLAVVVLRAGSGGPPPSSDELLAWTNERVGRQQRVAALRFRATLPRNPNGKVLKRELRTEYAS